jgi:hypothetical protein
LSPPPANGERLRAASDDASRRFSGCGGWKKRDTEVRSVVSVAGK